jgi:hypothetical protein
MFKGAFDIRLISAARAPTSLATTRHVVLAAATSLITVRACGSPRPKYSAAFSARSIEHVPSSRSIFVVRMRAFRIRQGGIEIIGGRQRPTGSAQPEKAVVAPVIVDVRDQHIEHHSP